MTGTDDPLDLLVLGSGVAGLTAAVRAADQHGLRVGVITKGKLDQGTTPWAQGGVAAVLVDDTDSTDLHLTDTLNAGAGLCDPDAVRVLVDDGPERVNELMDLGARFDTDELGRLELAREGGHSLARIVHAGGAATGLEVERALVAAVQLTATAVLDHTFAFDLVVEGGECVGVRSLDSRGSEVEVRARNVLLATGGAGQVYAVTTNPPEVTGDGIAMALRAGVAVADVEFVQFHPTALHHPRMPRPLLSEALRGDGALLLDASGERFVDELAPRDVVSRAMTARMIEQGVEHLWLDARGIDGFALRFPSIHAPLAEIGLDPASDLLPIAPAAHYTCGGVVTDLDGASSMPGLWAAGEVACSGVHGANRLASNSLLEGMVFGSRIIDAIGDGRRGPRSEGAMRSVLGGGGEDVIGGVSITDWRTGPPEPPGGYPSGEVMHQNLRDRLQKAMTIGAGVLRDEASLAETLGLLDALAVEAGVPDSPEAHELENLRVVARAIVSAAAARRESRGAHTRRDHPDTDPDRRHRLVFSSR